MKAHLYLPLTFISIATLTSCADSCKRPAEAPAPVAQQDETPAKSTATRSVATGKVVHMSDLVTRGTNAATVLQETISGHEKVVLDFYAEWCGPCKKLGPFLDKLAPKYPDVLFIKIDTDAFNDLSKEYGVKGIPALRFYKNGKQVEKVSGFQSESDMKALLAKLD